MVGSMVHAQPNFRVTLDARELNDPWVAPSGRFGRSNDMPAWGEALTDDQIHGLLAYVRHFCKTK
jgi:mono/diheme cytochrome c family protein